MPPKTKPAAPKVAPPTKWVKDPALRRKSTKPARTNEQQLERLFTSLCAQIEGGHFQNAIKTCDKILRLAPNDEDTTKTKLFLLLQTDRYAQALEMLENRSGSSTSTPFDKSYVLYRLHREQDAREILGDVANSDPDRGTLHLDAQIKFRQGEYHSARDVYNELLDSCPPETDEYNDILTNLDATQTYIDFLEKGYLESIHALPSSQSASALEALPAPSIVSALPTSATIPTSSNAPAAAAAAKASRKTKPKRLPKGVVPGSTPAPDPERWLKKRERTHRYDGGRRRKTPGGTGGAATQGAAVADLVPGVNTSAAKATGGGAGGGASGGGGGKKGKKGK